MDSSEDSPIESIFTSEYEIGVFHETGVVEVGSKLDEAAARLLLAAFLGSLSPPT